MGNTYTYYNLQIKSEFSLTMRKSHDCNTSPDLTIERGGEPSFSPAQGISHGFTGKDFFISSPEFGAVLNQRDSRIKIALMGDYTEMALSQFLIQNVLPIAMFFKGMLQLHASVISKDGQGVCIFGESGAGKSTLAANFVNAGYNLLDDDRTVLREKEGVLIAQGNHPRACLGIDGSLNIDLSAWNKIDVRDDGKGIWAPPGAVWHDSARLSHLIYVYVGKTFDIRVEEPSKHLFPILGHLVFSPVLAKYFAGDFLRLVELFFSKTPLLVYRRVRDSSNLKIVELLEDAFRQGFSQVTPPLASA